MKYVEKLGLIHERNNLLNRVVSLNRFSLENGNLFLHFYAFIPAIELLGSEEQIKYWIPLANELKITGAYV